MLGGMLHKYTTQQEPLCSEWATKNDSCFHIYLTVYPPQKSSTLSYSQSFKRISPMLMLLSISHLKFSTRHPHHKDSLLRCAPCKRTAKRECRLKIFSLNACPNTVSKRMKKYISSEFPNISIFVYHGQFAEKGERIG